MIHIENLAFFGIFCSKVLLLYILLNTILYYFANNLFLHLCSREISLSFSCLFVCFSPLQSPCQVLVSRLCWPLKIKWEVWSVFFYCLDVIFLLFMYFFLKYLEKFVNESICGWDFLYGKNFKYIINSMTSQIFYLYLFQLWYSNCFIKINLFIYLYNYFYFDL